MELAQLGNFVNDPGWTLTNFLVPELESRPWRGSLRQDESFFCAAP